MYDSYDKVLVASKTGLVRIEAIPQCRSLKESGFGGIRESEIVRIVQHRRLYILRAEFVQAYYDGEESSAVVTRVE